MTADSVQQNHNEKEREKDVHVNYTVDSVKWKRWIVERGQRAHEQFPWSLVRGLMSVRYDASRTSYLCEPMKQTDVVWVIFFFVFFFYGENEFFSLIKPDSCVSMPFCRVAAMSNSLETLPLMNAF